MACAPSEDSDQPGHPPSLIRIFAVRMKKAWVLSYPLSTHRRLRSDWVVAQADLSLRWAHCHFICFVMRRLICPLYKLQWPPTFSYKFFYFPVSAMQKFQNGLHSRISEKLSVQDSISRIMPFELNILKVYIRHNVIYLYVLYM